MTENEIKAEVLCVLASPREENLWFPSEDRTVYLPQRRGGAEERRKRELKAIIVESLRLGVSAGVIA